jgi:hypothetical protein
VLRAHTKNTPEAAIQFLVLERFILPSSSLLAIHTPNEPHLKAESSLLVYPLVCAPFYLGIGWVVQALFSCVRTVSPFNEAVNRLLKLGLHHKTSCMTKMKRNV